MRANLKNISRNLPRFRMMKEAGPPRRDRGGNPEPPPSPRNIRHHEILGPPNKSRPHPRSARGPAHARRPRHFLRNPEEPAADRTHWILRMAPAVTSQWVKVRSNPPTWYPRGTPADCPTDHRSGEWIHTGDSQGTSYFIPLHGMARDQRKSLVKDALAARSTRKQALVAAEDCAICIQEAGNIVVGGPLTILALYGASASSPNQTVSDFELIRLFGR